MPRATKQSNQIETDGHYVERCINAVGDVNNSMTCTDANIKSKSTASNTCRLRQLNINERHAPPPNQSCSVDIASAENSAPAFANRHEISNESINWPTQDLDRAQREDILHIGVGQTRPGAYHIDGMTSEETTARALYSEMTDELSAVYTLPVMVGVVLSDTESSRGGLAVSDPPISVIEGSIISERKKSTCSRIICENMSSNRNKILVTFLFLILFTVTISFGLLEQSRNRGQPQKPAPSEKKIRFEAIFDIVSSVSTISSLNDTNSPQYMALEWISDVDSFQISTTRQDLLLQRYISAILLFSASLPYQNYTTYFLKLHECDWNEVVDLGTISIREGITCDGSKSVNRIFLGGAFYRKMFSICHFLLNSKIYI